MRTPTTRPLKSIADLMSFTPHSDPFNVSTVPLIPRPSPNPTNETTSTTRPNIPNVIVCHDMAGGYKEDAFPQGLEFVEHPYAFQYWTFVDQFIYFTHERFSIPPPTWTNAAHRNGVFVYATFITEWGPGVIETLRALYGPNYNPEPRQVPDDEPDMSPYPEAEFDPTVANKMVELAKHYNFDGWFINIESELRAPAHAAAMLTFLTHLTKTMHAHLPHSKVLWYDSLTIQSKLRWQNQLNLNNVPFFDSTDGIFANYTWKPTYPSSSARVARAKERGRDRAKEVYMGIDVWGRNTYGGGGFNVHKALREKYEEVDLRFWCGEPRLLEPEFPPMGDEEKEKGGRWGTREDEDDLGSRLGKLVV
ncbi:hypothetical protein HDV05_006977 [Chytridiales sp. JEL 0842]|nr:hypothetical protein HDV05_006977 [Chytridiales sp. JEL 0842]